MEPFSRKLHSTSLWLWGFSMTKGRPCQLPKRFSGCKIWIEESMDCTIQDKMGFWWVEVPSFYGTFEAMLTRVHLFVAVIGALLLSSRNAVAACVPGTVLASSTITFYGDDALDVYINGTSI